MGQLAWATMFLSGTYDLAIDNKNRLSIPFTIRRKLSEDRDGHSFYVVAGRRRGTLALYPEKYFERLRAADPADDSLSDAAYAFRQFEYSQSALLEPDAQGRVLLPDRLVKRVGLAASVILIGVRDHLEVWRPEDFEAFDNEMWPAYPERRTKALEEMKQLAPAVQAGSAEPGIAPAE